MKTWYKQPAKVIENEKQNSERKWLKALSLGNGSLGLMVFGDVNREHIQLNEETTWSGSVTDSDNSDAHKALDKIRKLLFDGKYREETELTKKTHIGMRA